MATIRKPAPPPLPKKKTSPSSDHTTQHYEGVLSLSKDALELRPKTWTQKQRFLDNTSGLLGSPLGLELGRGEVA